jgi:hypothetical protein
MLERIADAAAKREKLLGELSTTHWGRRVGAGRKHADTKPSKRRGRRQRKVAAKSSQSAPRNRSVVARGLGRSAERG